MTMRRHVPESRSVPPARPPDLPWHQRLNITSVSLIIFLLAIVGSLPALRGSGRDLDHAANLLRFLKRFFPPDFSVSGQILEALVETIQIAVMATFFSIVLAFPLAAAGAQTLSPRWLVAISRMVMNCIRTIPSLIWALLAVAVVGPHPLAGVIGLSFYSLGYLGKFFSDAFESVDLEVARGLRAIGAGRIQAFQHGLWPNTRPLIWSYSLWMLEYNIRSASIVGYVGAGGVGVLLHVYQEYYQWDRFAAVLVFILGLVTLLDLAGEHVRRQVAPRIPGSPIGA
jgi:phosphonate ABC transporter permease subunit PhnE